MKNTESRAAAELRELATQFVSYKTAMSEPPERYLQQFLNLVDSMPELLKEWQRWIIKYSSWRNPIDNHPKDEEQILCLIDGVYALCIYSAQSDTYEAYHPGYRKGYRSSDITGWMELPICPNRKDADSKVVTIRQKYFIEQ